MASPNISFTYNAYQSNLAGPLLAGLTTVALDFIPNGLGVPAYLVIDPDIPASREYIKVLAYTGNTIDSMERNLEGSAGDVDHLVGAVIRAVYTMQMLNDTFVDIGANADALVAHAGDVGDPHAAAGYIKQAEADARYVELTGDTMSGRLTIDNDAVFSPFTVNRLVGGVDGVADFGTQAQGGLPVAMVRHSSDGVTDGTLQVGQGLFRVWDGDTASELMIDLSLTKATFAANVFSLPNISPTGAAVNIPNVWMDGAGRLFEQTDPLGASDAHNDLRYLKLSGGTMTGQLVGIAGSAVTPGVAVATHGMYSAGGSQLGFSVNGTTSFLAEAARIRGQGGTALAPAYGFIGTSNIGMYLATSAQLGFSADGINSLLLTSTQIRTLDGALGSPSHSFISDSASGMYRPASGSVALVAAGVAAIRATALRTYLLPAYGDTTGVVANVSFIAADGRLGRNTSARRYKSNIQAAPQLADLVLEPVTFHHDGDETDYIGFIADDMPDERAIVRDADTGEVENYDVRAVVAILVAKVNRLENA